MTRTRWILALAIGVLGVIAALPLMAQVGGGGGGNGGNGGGGRMNFQQMMQDRIKTAMNATDDEWKVLQPKVEAVQTAQTQVQAANGRGFGRGGRGGRGGNNNNNTPPAADDPAAKARDLQAALDNKDSTTDQIKEKLAALREARTKAHDALVKAQNELKELVTVRQEAVLVNMGLLE
jgi:hypothetical protein